MISPMLLIWIGLIASSKACTEFILKVKDNSIILGRSFDFTIAIPPGIFTEPKGITHQASLPPSCGSKGMKWTNLHKVIQVKPSPATLNHLSGEGINDAGLSVGALYLPGFTVYENISEDRCRNAISQMQVVTYILAQYGNVQEVRDALDSDKFPSVWGEKALGAIHPLHYAITDKRGNAIILEYTAEGRKVHNNSIRVTTNSPTYEWHVMNWKLHVNLSNKKHPKRTYYDSQGKEDEIPQLQGSGLLGLPGDYTAVSRFIRTAALVHYSTVPETSEKAIIAAIHILNAVDEPKGVSEGDGDAPNYTQWSVVKDLTNNCMYYRTYDCPSMQKICFSDVAEKAEWFALDDNIQDCVVNMAAKLMPLKTEL